MTPSAVRLGSIQVEPALATRRPAPGDEREPRDEREARFSRLLYRWWLEEQPAWTERGWWESSLRDDVRALLWLPAGALLAGALAALERHEVCPLAHPGESPPGQPAPGHAPGYPCACQVVVAAAWQAVAGWATAGSTEALIEAAGPESVVVALPVTGQRITDPAREELAAALRMSPGSMSNRIAAARELMAQPRLLADVTSAAISPWAARLVVLEVADLTAEQADAVVDQVCTRLESRRSRGIRSWTSAEVGRAARMIRRRLCPDTDRAARERALRRRRVQILPDKFGMATLVADLDETHAYRIHRRLSAIAQGLGDTRETRNHDQIRADVFVDLLLGAATAGGAEELPDGPEGNHRARHTAQRVAGEREARTQDPSGAATRAAVQRPVGLSRPEIQVVVAWETLLAMSDEPACIPGLGTISPDVARELAADGRWRAWVTDSRGAVMATGAATYTPSAGLARLVRAREPHCRMAGCRRPAEACDLDHTVPYPQGPTAAANLGPLCRRHHNLKTHLGWQLKPMDPHPTSGSPPPTLGRPPSAGPPPATLGPPPPAGWPATVGQPPPAGPPAIPGQAPPAGWLAWQWLTPTGFAITDHVGHPLE